MWAHLHVYTATLGRRVSDFALILGAEEIFLILAVYEYMYWAKLKRQKIN